MSAHATECAKDEADRIAKPVPKDVFMCAYRKFKACDKQATTTTTDAVAKRAAYFVSVFVACFAYLRAKHFLRIACDATVAANLVKGTDNAKRLAENAGNAAGDAWDAKQVLAASIAATEKAGKEADKADQDAKDANDNKAAAMDYEVPG